MEAFSSYRFLRYKNTPSGALWSIVVSIENEGGVTKDQFTLRRRGAILAHFFCEGKIFGRIYGGFHMTIPPFCPKYE
jgi:hypothetical protein